jgi:general secretion pathway protein N
VLRFLAVVLLVAAFFLVRLPGSLVDSAIEQTSDGAVRLAQAEGTLWRGSGSLMVIDPVTQRWQAWLPMTWDTDPSRLWRGALSWQFTSGGAPLADVEIGPTGVRLTRLQMRGPARFFLERIPSAIGRAGWEGDLAIDSPGWQCSWSLRCDGTAELRWFGASSDLLQKHRLGDYRVAITGKGSDISAHFDTLSGDIRIDGDGRWSLGSSPSFAGTLRGDPVLLDRLPNIAGRWVRSGGEPGVWLVSLP